MEPIKSPNTTPNSEENTEKEISEDLIDRILEQKLSAEKISNFDKIDPIFSDQGFDFQRLDQEIPPETPPAPKEPEPEEPQNKKSSDIPKEISEAQSKDGQEHEDLTHGERIAWINRLRRSTVHNPNNKQNFLDLGIELMNIGDYDAALIALRRATQIDRKYGNAYLNLGICYYAMGFKDRAIQSYLDCAEVEPTNDHAYANLGSIYLESEDYENALLFYQKAIENNPKNFNALRNRSLLYLYDNKNDLAYQSASALVELPEATSDDWMVFGVILANLEQHEEAIFAYEKAIELNPNNAILYSNQANSYKEIREFSLAEDRYCKAIELNPNEPDFRYNLAEYFMGLNKMDAAQSEYKKATELNPKDNEAWMGLAITLENINPLESLKAATKAVESGLQSVDALDFLAKIQERNGLLDQAFKTREKLFQKSPLHAGNTQIYGIHVLRKGNPLKAWEILKKIEKPKSEDLEEWWAISENLRYRNKSTEEFDCLLKILKTDTKFYRAWDRLGVIALLKKMPLKAYEYFSRSGGLSNLRYEMNIYLNEALLEINEDEKAAQVALNMSRIARFSPKIWSKILRNHRRNNYLDSLVNKLIENLFREDGSYHELLEFAKVLDSMKLYEHSEKIYERLLATYPENEEILNQRSLNLIEQKRIEEAKQLLKHRLKENGDYEIHNTYGEALYLEGKDDEAYEQFMESLKYRQDDYRVWFNLGNIEVRRKNFQKGIEFYEKSLSIWDGEAKTWYNLGYTLESMGNMKQALEKYQTCTNKNRKNAQGWNAIGVINYENNHLKSAKHCFLRSLAQDKQYKNAWNNLAIVFEELNQQQKADACLQEYEKLGGVLQNGKNANSGSSGGEKSAAKEEQNTASNQSSSTASNPSSTASNPSSSPVSTADGLEEKNSMPEKEATANPSSVKTSPSFSPVPGKRRARKQFNPETGNVLEKIEDL